MCAPSSKSMHVQVVYAGCSTRLVRCSVEFSYKSGQIHLRLSCLKPAFHRSVREFLEFIRARALKEEIRIPTNVLNGRKRDCVHALLYHRMTRCGKTGNPKRERPDEI